MSDPNASPPEGGQGAAPVSPPAAPPAEGQSPPSPPAAPPPPPPEPFFRSLKDPALRGYAEVKGYKQTDQIEFAEAILKSYQNLEKLRGVPEERLLTLPENMDDAEAMKPIYEKLGLATPEKHEDYGFSAMEGVTAETAAVATEYEKLAFKHGIPVKKAQAVFADILAMEQQGRESLMNEVAEETAAELGRLQGKWGAKYDENVEIARRAVRKFGFSETQLQAMETSVGAAELYERFHAIGQSLNEGSFIEGKTKTDGFVLTPEGARAERDRLMGDPAFMDRYLKGDKAAAEKMERLNRTIAGASAGAGA